ncbi:MAG TPA: DUF1552 domain-containing protein [Polyangiaceae bacterium]|nr:DUF1552 domain-containing protein [Polyangiaceae bacterium]
MISYKLARRSFLGGCGGSAALLLPLLRSIEARAQGLPPPLRFLVIRHSQGSPLDLWRPADTATTTTYSLPANSAAFAPLQSKMVLIDGLNIVCASKVAGNAGGTNTSEGGTVALMTGVPTLGQLGQQDHCAGGESIDQLFLDQSPVLGGAGAPMSNRTLLGSLQLAADVRSDRDEVGPRVLSYRPPNLANATISLQRQPMFPETDPLAAFTKIFGAALPPGTGAASLLSQKLSVLDFMRSDLARLTTLIPASENTKLLAFADAIQALEATLRGAIANLPGAACVVPATPPMIPQTTVMPPIGLDPQPSGGTKLSGYDYYESGDPNSHPHQVVGRLHLSILKAAFLCDLARVATFSWSSGTSWVIFPGTFDGATLPGAPVWSTHYGPLSANDPATTAWWEAIDRFYSDQTSQALQEFDAATDVDGVSTLLDNTVIPYVSEVARRLDHNQQNVPFLVFGGKNTRIQGGTFLKVTDGSLGTQSGSTGNRPVNDAWLALAPIFGVNLASLGSPAQFTGPLPGVIA